MRWMEKVRMRMQMLFHRGRAAEQLQAEMEFHLEHQIAENVAAGMSAEEARFAALRTFGNPAALRDQTRDSWSWNGLESLLHDLRIAARTLARTPGFALTAIVVMALGMGANVALFTLVRSVLLRPLPFRDPDRLLQVFDALSDGRTHDNIVDPGSFAVWQQHAHSFSDLAITEGMQYNLGGAKNELPEVVRAQMASWNLFRVLDVQAARGRLFTAEDDRPQSSATVVLTWGLWQRRYGGDASIVGRTIEIDDKATTVIGILPAWFSWPDARVQLWMPAYHVKSAELMGMYVAHQFDVVGRLRPRVTVAQASDELNVLQLEIHREHPEPAVFDAVNVRPLLEAETVGLRRGLYALFGATGCLLLIACLNVANLLVARSASRRREQAVRMALGGSRMRLLREQLMESSLITALGGGMGLLFAAGLTRWLLSTRTDIPRAEAIHGDGMVALFVVAAVGGCALISGLIPALSSRKMEVTGALRESSRPQSGSSGRTRLRQGLLAIEVGLTVVLLIGAGLLLRSYTQLRSVDLGCDPHNLLTMEISLPKTSYPSGAQRVAFYEQLLARVRAVPGVQAAGLANALPGEGWQRDDVFTIAGEDTPAGGMDALTRFADPDYFGAMRIPLVQGESFAPSIRLDAAREIVVNQAFVRKYFPGQNPIGRAIEADMVLPGAPLRIVGVAGDTRDLLERGPVPVIYYPLYSGAERSVVLVARTRGHSTALALPIQKAIAAVGRGLPVAHVLTMDDVIGVETLTQRFDATLLVAFAVLSLLLAMVGLFGVLSFMVAQRTTEIGIRIALGAQRKEILQLMLRSGLRPALWGLVLGLAASVGLTRLITSMLFGTQPLDPVVYALVSVMLLAVAAVACLLPAWRAAQVDPMVALRAE
jgi:predicted permease